jgi:NTP pyrophosphatase (non-canonical NTP hydrolase)
MSDEATSSESSLTFKRYHELMRPTAFYPGIGNNFVYPALAAAEEAGELAGKVKKLWRDFECTANKHINNPILISEEFQQREALRQGALKEIGDVLWYLDAIAEEFGTSLEECARLNVQKILDRQARGVLGGQGDNR